MAGFEDGSYSSVPGIALIAKVLAGRCQMKYTRASVGKGTIPEGESPKTMREPAGYVMEAKISAVTNPVDGECQVTVQINSADVEKGFYATGIVLYAEDPDEGEVPYTYLVLENGPEWIRPSSSVVGKLATFDLIAAVGDVDRVTATIDPDSVVTRSVVEQLIDGKLVDFKGATDSEFDDLREAIQAINTSSVTITDITIPTSGWTEDADTGGAYALCTDIAAEEITEEMIPVLTILPAGQKAAGDCGLCTAARTINGALRVYAQSVPPADIGCSLALLCSGGAAGGGAGAGYVLLAATETRLGGVRIGGNVDVTSDGTISVDTEKLLDGVSATDEEVTEMLDEVFDGPGPDGTAAGTV